MGHVEVARILLNHGAKIEDEDYTQMTPLHHAAKEGCAEIVDLLLTKGAQLEAKSWLWKHLSKCHHVEWVRNETINKR